jgi:DNA topoisomerase-6 subunit B
MAKRTAKDLAKGQRAISVSEFFAKNRHLLGFDNPTRALMTTVKEAVDNALDACEEAHILPWVEVRIKGGQDGKLTVCVSDNGPGIVRQQVGRIFGKLLYGSKFHRLKQSRGQQGIGISAAGMYGMLTTGKAVKVTTCTDHKGTKAHSLELQIDTATNEPVILKEDKNVEYWRGGTGTTVEIEILGRIIRGRSSVREYVEQTAVANPHATLRYKEPNGEWVEFPRTIDELPKEPREIKPHPEGIDIGVLGKMLKDTKARTVSAFLRKEFSRVSAGMANKACKAAGVKTSLKPSECNGYVEALAKALRAGQYPAPPKDCLVPIGEEQILATLNGRFDCDFSCAVTRKPAVYRGNPFQVEVGLTYSAGRSGEESELEGEGQEPARLLRLANRVPLLYQQGACAITQAATGVAWKQYGISQPRGGLPTGNLVIMVHIASVWVPFTSESKEAVAAYDDVIKEIKLAIQAAGRKLGGFIKKREKARAQAKRKQVFELYIQEVAECCSELNGSDADGLKAKLTDIASKITGHAHGKEKDSAASDQATDEDR